MPHLASTSPDAALTRASGEYFAGCGSTTSAGAGAATLGALSHALTSGDYRLATHACAALAKVAGETVVPPRRARQGLFRLPNIPMMPR